MSACTHRAGLTALLAAVGLLSGCVIRQKEIEDIYCCYRFHNVERSGDRDRIDRLIRAAAKGNVAKSGSEQNPEYTFVVARLSALDALHPKLLYENPEVQDSELTQVFASRNPQFQIIYETIDIAASIQVVVRFKITAGARLYYKPEGELERDISDQVDASGNVSFRTKIRRGQDYIFGRTVAGNVQRYVRINVYTQEVKDIDKGQYP